MKATQPASFHFSHAATQAGVSLSGKAIDSASRPVSSTRPHLSREFPRSATTRSTA